METFEKLCHINTYKVIKKYKDLDYGPYGDILEVVEPGPVTFFQYIYHWANPATTIKYNISQIVFGCIW